MATRSFPRVGAWAKTAEGIIGIIFAIRDVVNEIKNGEQPPNSPIFAGQESGQVAEVHHVDPKTGETNGVSYVPVTPDTLQQAKFMDIPKVRRPERSHGRALGYE